MMFIGGTIRLVFFIWVMLYALMMGFGALMTSGPTDFNGNPNTLADHIFNGSVITLSVLQIALLGKIARKPRLLFAGMLVASASLPWAVSALAYHDLGALAVPLIYSAGIGLLCLAYWRISLAVAGREATQHPKARPQISGRSQSDQGGIVAKQRKE